MEPPGPDSRPFICNLADGKATAARPADAGLIGDTPSKPFGGGEELAWGADSRTIFFTLRKADRNEPMSTNLDIYSWLVDSRMMPVNLTEDRSEEHTSELPSLMRISYAVFCLQKKSNHNNARQKII